MIKLFCAVRGQKEVRQLRTGQKTGGGVEGKAFRGPVREGARCWSHLHPKRSRDNLVLF